MPYCFVCDEEWVEEPRTLCPFCIGENDTLIDAEVEDDEPATDVDFG